MNYKSIYESPIGTIILTSNGENLTGLCFTTSRFPGSRKVDKEQINNKLKIFKITKKWLDRYFNGDKPNLNEIPIRLIGTEFSKEVWEILKTIPYGKAITYGEIANKVAQKRGVGRMSAQAVGHAVGRNPISIIIPCHRVIGTGGNLTGYGEGLDVKVGLLKLENVNVSEFYIPKKGNAL